MIPLTSGVVRWFVAVLVSCGATSLCAVLAHKHPVIAVWPSSSASGTTVQVSMRGRSRSGHNPSVQPFYWSVRCSLASP